MSDAITLSEVQEFIAGFWFHYDQGHFDELALRIGDEMEYVSRSESGACPFEDLLEAELHGGAETLAWLTQHRNENPYPLRHHATNIFRTGVDGPVTNVRFYLFVNQITNAVPFAVSSGVVDVGIRRGDDGLVFTSMKVILDADDSVPSSNTATRPQRQARSRHVRSRHIRRRRRRHHRRRRRHRCRPGAPRRRAWNDGGARRHRRRGGRSAARRARRGRRRRRRPWNAMSATPMPCKPSPSAPTAISVRSGLLVNNAGVEQFGYLWDTPVENWNRLVDINISGVFHGVRAFLPPMIDAGAPAWVWNLSSIGGVAAVPLQAPYIMSKHAVLALTECLRLEVQQAGHNHIHVQAVLPGSGGFQHLRVRRRCRATGDVAAAESQRGAMLDIKADAMDPLAAADAVFEQAAEGRFYLLTQPDYVGSAMAERAEVLVSQTAAGVAIRPSFRPGAPVRLDPDAAARVASFGAMSPMRVRGLTAVRHAIESAPHPDDMPSMANIEDCAIPGPAGQIPVRIYRPSTASVAPVLVYFHGGGMVMGSNHSFEPLARTLAAQSNATVVSVDYRLAPEFPAPAQFDDAYTATEWVAAARRADGC